MVRKQTNGPCPNWTFNTSTNQISTSGFSYDAAGNLTADGTGTGSHTYQWDAEGRLSSVNGVNYTYDAYSRRIMKSNGSLYWYGQNGEVLEETDNSGNLQNDYVYFAGSRLARRDAAGNVLYYFGDHLDSSRSITTSTGTLCYDADFYPFGGERAPYVNTCSQNYKFTSLERDAESGKDHTLFRQYASNLGRWLSPDPLGGDVLNPQSLNRYAYALNNPTSLVDPLGLSCENPADGKPCVVTVVGQATYIMPLPSNCTFTSHLQIVCTSPQLIPPGTTLPNGPGPNRGGNPGGGAVNMKPVLQALHNCAGAKANTLSVASIFGLQNNSWANFFLSNSIAAAAQLSYGTPTASGAASTATGVAASEVAGRAGSSLSGLGTALTSYTASAINHTYVLLSSPAGSAVASETTIEMAAPSTASKVIGKILAGTGKAVANVLTFQSAYDAIVYTGGMVACAEE